MCFVGMLNDNLSPSKIVEIFSMSSYRGAVMPLVNRGKTPNWDRFAPVKMDKVELMHFWVQAAHTEYTIAWAEKKISALVKQNASTTDIEDLIAEIYSKLYYDRIVRWHSHYVDVGGEWERANSYNTLHSASYFGMLYSEQNRV